jgi:hypothetical protein
MKGCHDQTNVERELTQWCFESGEIFDGLLVWLIAEAVRCFLGPAGLHGFLLQKAATYLHFRPKI